MQDVSHWKVLIVDDEPDNINVVKLVMEFHDIPVWTAASGPECLALLETVTPTLLLMDIQMPTMSGVQLLEKIREREGWKNIAVVAVTAYSMQGDRERLISTGFDGYIGKPINAITLVEELSAIMKTRDER